MVIQSRKMPVQTRSQMKTEMINISDSYLGSRKDLKLVTWFVKYSNDMISLNKKMNYEKNTYKTKATFLRNSQLKGKDVKKQIKELETHFNDIQYDQLRVIIELYYMFEKYIGIIIDVKRDNNNGAYLRLARSAYKNIQSLRVDIINQGYSPNTKEEKHALKTLFNQFNATENELVKYIPKNELYCRGKRVRK